MPRFSFLAEPLDWSDVTIKVVNTTNASSRRTRDGKFIDTSVSAISEDGKITPSIHVECSIATGRISFENLDREDWSFGFAQALKARECVVEYAGARSNAGSVIVAAFDARDNEPVFTDSHETDPIDARPWTKAKPIRFTYHSTTLRIELDTFDAPGMRVPAVIGNGASKAENLLRRVSDKRQICCALAVEDPRNFREPQILGHALWDIDLSFTYTYRDKGKLLVPQFTGSVLPGQFKEGLPADAGYRKIFDRSFIAGDPYNARASELLNRHVRALKSDRKDERETRLPTVPENFFP